LVVYGVILYQLKVYGAKLQKAGSLGAKIYFSQKKKRSWENVVLKNVFDVRLVGKINDRKQLVISDGSQK
jgi:hypothetical protein